MTTYSDIFVNKTANTSDLKAQESAKLAQDVEAWLALGNKIEQVPMGKTNYRSAINPANPPKVFE